MNFRGLEERFEEKLCSQRKLGRFLPLGCVVLCGQSKAFPQAFFAGPSCSKKTEDSIRWIIAIWPKHFIPWIATNSLDKVIRPWGQVCSSPKLLVIRIYQGSSPQRRGIFCSQTPSCTLQLCRCGKLMRYHIIVHNLSRILGRKNHHKSVQTRFQMKL